MKVLITGGFGFIGSHFVQKIFSNTYADITIIDDFSNSEHFNIFLEYLERTNTDNNNIMIHKWNIQKEIKSEIYDYDYIIHFAAQGHVDKSIIAPIDTAMSNTIGTLNVLEFARKQKNLKKFIYFSTDEVFGPESISGKSNENTAYHCTNPYSASKAGGEEFVTAYHHTYKLPTIITHCTNVFGERQQSSAFIPLCINKILHNETLTIHTSNGKIPKRNYIYVEDVCDAVFLLMTKDVEFGKYNIAGPESISILSVANQISHGLGLKARFKFSEIARPYTDDNYNIDNRKLKSTGWDWKYTFEEKLPDVIAFYLENT